MKKDYLRNLEGSRLISRSDENPIWSILLIALSIFLICLLIFSMLVGVCKVRMNSMNDTLFEGDNVLVSRYPTSIKAGDIVVFDTSDMPGLGDRLLIKRVVAVGGDTVKFVLEENSLAVSLYVKAKGAAEFIKADEPYIKEEMQTGNGFLYIEYDKEYEIPEKCLYALGDNRNNSDDSRKFGVFATDDVYGKMFYKLKKGSFLEWIFLFVYN